MSRRRSTSESRCPRCRINLALCFCDQLTPVPTRTRVLFLMHHREKHLTSNTATQAHNILPNSLLKMRGLPDQECSLEEVLDPNYQALLLYPDEDAVELNAQFVLPDRPILLVVPDGTWRQAKKFRRREPLLAKLPCVKLPVGLPSEYALRKQHMEGGLSTYEATVRALGVLEGTVDGPQLQARMESVFREMSRRFLVARHCFGAPEKLPELL